MYWDTFNWREWFQPDPIKNKKTGLFFGISNSNQINTYSGIPNINQMKKKTNASVVSPIKLGVGKVCILGVGKVCIIFISILYRFGDMAKW